MKNLKNYIVYTIIIFLIVFIYFLNKEISYLHNCINRHSECIEQLGNDCIQFENMHADHYAFEEYKVLELIDLDKANDYKQFLDSIKNK